MSLHKTCFFRDERGAASGRPSHERWDVQEPVRRTGPAAGHLAVRRPREQRFRHLRGRGRGAVGEIRRGRARRVRRRVADAGCPPSAPDMACRRRSRAARLRVSSPSGAARTGRVAADSAAVVTTAVGPPARCGRRVRVRAMVRVPLLDSARPGPGPGTPGGQPLAVCEAPQGGRPGRNRVFGPLWHAPVAAVRAPRPLRRPRTRPARPKSRGPRAASPQRGRHPRRYRFLRRGRTVPCVHPANAPRRGGM